MYAGTPNFPYLVFRCSLLSSYGIWSIIANKQRILCTKYPKEMYLYWMKEESDSKEMDCFKFDMIFR